MELGPLPVATEPRCEESEEDSDRLSEKGCRLAF